MKAARENEGSKRTLKAASVAFILLISAICGGGCSSRHAMMTAPYQETEESVVSSSQAEEVLEAVETEETEETNGNISQSYTRVGQEVFKVSNLLFTVVDSISNIGK